MIRTLFIYLIVLILLSNQLIPKKHHRQRHVHTPTQMFVRGNYYSKYSDLFRFLLAIMCIALNWTYSRPLSAVIHLNKTIATTYIYCLIVIVVIIDYLMLFKTTWWFNVIQYLYSLQIYVYPLIINSNLTFSICYYVVISLHGNVRLVLFPPLII